MLIRENDTKDNYKVNIPQVVYWESVLKVHNSGLMSFFVKADIFIRVSIFYQ